MAIKGLEIEGRSPSINSGCSISLPNLRFGRNWQRQEMAIKGLRKMMEDGRWWSLERFGMLRFSSASKMQENLARAKHGN